MLSPLAATTKRSLQKTFGLLSLFNGSKRPLLPLLPSVNQHLMNVRPFHQSIVRTYKKSKGCGFKDPCEKESKCPQPLDCPQSKNKCPKLPNAPKPTEQWPKFVSMWELPERTKKRQELDAEMIAKGIPRECCPPCYDIRFDELYYRASNKCRKFQRTWWECCPRLVPKRVCCWCDAVPPEVERRCPEKPKCRPPNTCKPFEGKCPKIAMPCCRQVRVPPKCYVGRRKRDCQKVCCPYPSFSECVKMKLADIPQRPPECRCLDNVAMCTVMAYEEYAKRAGIPIWPCRPRRA